ncbi:MAG: hypothetical protein JWO26_4 [Rhodospirillales bacterium]|jgi:hypothetical protein|nr:hypothetical protein [Rhodospirillales bacterium]
MKWPNWQNMTQYAESKHGMLVDVPENDVFVQGLGVN